MFCNLFGTILDIGSIQSQLIQSCSYSAVQRGFGSVQKSTFQAFGFVVLGISAAGSADRIAMFDSSLLNYYVGMALIGFILQASVGPSEYAVEHANFIRSL